MNEHTQKDCSICMCEFEHDNGGDEDNDIVIVCSVCQQPFHRGCVNMLFATVAADYGGVEEYRYYYRREITVKCPTCRIDVRRQNIAVFRMFRDFIRINEKAKKLNELTPLQRKEQMQKRIATLMVAERRRAADDIKTERDKITQSCRRLENYEQTLKKRTREAEQKLEEIELNCKEELDRQKKEVDDYCTRQYEIAMAKAKVDAEFAREKIIAKKTEIIAFYIERWKKEEAEIKKRLEKITHDYHHMLAQHADAERELRALKMEISIKKKKRAIEPNEAIMQIKQIVMKMEVYFKKERRYERFYGGPERYTGYLAPIHSTSVQQIKDIYDEVMKY